jgi:sulfatase maturation enzyme AslB (radical SAM superfamily)
VRELDGYTLFIKPTKNCNLNCSYCDLPAEKIKMSSDMAQNISKFIKSSDENFDRILFTGGEPLLNPKIINIFAENFPEIKLKIITNGTVLNQKIQEIFLKNKDRISIILSFDGPKDIQDANRDNSFDKVMNNLWFFRHFITRVNTVVTPSTIFSLDRIIDFIKENIYPGYDILIANGIDWDEELDWDKFENYFRKKCMQYKNLKQILNIETKGFCECKNHLMINEKGDIYPCVNYDYPENRLGNIYDGIDENKRRPFNIAGVSFTCLLENREANGSIFKEKINRPNFIQKYFDLVREI